jgi:glycosyltransferase involved in cell wall biosynthesis
MSEITPLVSVIMPCFNAEKTVAVAIESVLSQTYTNWELIVVDDGSVDGTWGIVSTHTARDERIRCIRQKNAGVSAARNTAIREARGSLIALLDSDDECLPTRIALQVDYLLLHPAIDVVGAGMIEIDARSGAIIGISRPQLTHEILFRQLRYRCPFFASTVMIRRRFFSNVGAFNSTLTRAVDYDLWLRAARPDSQQIGCFSTDFDRAQDYFLWTSGAMCARYANIDLPLVRYLRRPRGGFRDAWYFSRAVFRFGLRGGDLLAMTWYPLRPLLAALLNMFLLTIFGKTLWLLKLERNRDMAEPMTGK